jgi:hypothetical protein
MAENQNQKDKRRSERLAAASEEIRIKSEQLLQKWRGDEENGDNTTEN